MTETQRIHDVANRIAEARIEDERRNRKPVIPDEVNPAFRFEKQSQVAIRHGVYLDENRRTAPHWKRTPYSGRIIVENPAPRPGEPRWDAGFGPDCLPDSVGGPYKLRIIRGLSTMIGAVIDSGAYAYLTAMQEYHANPFYARFEPCLDDEPLCGPVISSHFPESLARAREVYAEETGKDASKVDFKTLNAHFSEKEKSDNRRMIAK